jgi:hypothetical protein
LVFFFLFASKDFFFNSLLLEMQFTVYSVPFMPPLSIFFFHITFGLADKNCVAKVYIPSFFLARSSLSVQAKISTLGFQLRSYFVCEALQEEPGHLAKRHNFNQTRK